MSTLEDGVYVCTNKATGTCLDLGAGRSNNGALVVGWADNRHETSYYNQNWLIKYDPDVGAYTFQNVRGGTFMDLRGGSSANGTIIQGFSKATVQYANNQLWLIEGPAADGTYRIVNRGTKSCVEIGGGESRNGARVNAWKPYNVPHHAWFFERRDRRGPHITELLANNPFVREPFRSYKANISYLVCPQNTMQRLCDQKGIKSKRKSKETYDCDDFAYSMKAAVAEWAHDNVKVGLGVVCGVMYGNLMAGGRDGRYAYNWAPTHDWSSIRFFEPETGRFLENIGFNSYFGLY